MRIRISVLVTLSVLLACLGASEGFSAMLSPDDVLLRRLPSGLTVAVAEDHSSPVVAVRLYVKAGAIYEQEFLGCGISHFIEHVESDGTATMTKEQIDKYTDEFGGLTNAYTTSDHTCYHAAAPSKYFDKVLFILSHCLTEATFPEKEVNTQRGIIENEIAKDLDEPMRLLWRLLMTTMFKNHPVRYPTIGHKELFMQLRREHLVKYYRRMYTPENTTVVVVGDVDADEAMSKIEKAFEGFKARPFSLPLLPQEPAQMHTRKAQVRMDVKLAYLMLGYRSIPLQNEDLYALDVLAAILGNGRSARLVQSIKEEKCLVQDISVSSWTSRYGIGAFIIRSVLPAENLDETVDAVSEQLDLVKTGQVSTAELAKAKKLIKSDYLFNIDTMEQKASMLGSDILSTGDVSFSSAYLDKIESVTTDQLQAVAKKYLHQDRLNVVSVVPEDYQKESASTKRGKSKEEAFKKTVLDSGMTLLTKRGSKNDTLSIDAYFLGGTRFETGRTNGVASLMTSMLLKGTKTLSAAELALFIDEMGAEISARSDMNTFHISMRLLPDDLERGISIMADIIKNPAFKSEEFAKEQSVALSIIKRRDDLWYSRPNQVMLERLFGNHPYSMNKYGTEKSVSALTVADVHEYYEEFVEPSNMVLCISGATDSKSIPALVEKQFSGFSGEMTRPEIALEAPLDENVELSLESKWKQAVVVYGFRSCSVSSKDRYALEVLDGVLSGVYLPGGRLHSLLRGNKLVYLIHAYNRLGVDPGWFVVYASALPKNIERVQEIIEAELIRMQKEVVDKDEMLIAKGMCMSAELVRRRQTAAAQASAACLGELYGLGYDSYLNYEKEIEAVTAEDVMRVARKYLTTYVKVTSVPEQKQETADESSSPK